MEKSSLKQEVVLRLEIILPSCKRLQLILSSCRAIFSVANYRTISSISLALYFSLLCPQSHCQEFRWKDIDIHLGGHLKLRETWTSFDSRSIGASSTKQDQFQTTTDLRLNTDFFWKNWLLSINTEQLSLFRDDLRNGQTQSLAVNRSDGTLPDDNSRIVDISWEVGSGNDYSSVLRADRLSLEYSYDRFRARIGRQASSWGNGLAFSATDLFNPFAPVEIEKDYKTGDDMLWASVITSDKSSLELLTVGRRHSQTNKIAATESSFAVKYNYANNKFDTYALAARHYNENLLATGLSLDIEKAVFRTDLQIIELEDNDIEIVVLANIDRSWTIVEKNVYSYIEYFYNSMGTRRLDGASNELIERLQRSELFTINKNYLSTGAQIELLPILNSYTSTVINLNDGSGIIQKRFEYDAHEDLRLSLGGNIPFGSSSSEYGGLVVPNSTMTLGFNSEFYLRLEFFF